MNENADIIERLAACGFTVGEVAEVLEVQPEDLANDSSRKAYRKGFLTRQLELRERIFKDAKNGSSPAQTLAKKILDDCLTKNGGEL